MRALLIFLALASPLRAVWESPNAARITHGVGCLYRNQTLIRCYESAGTVVLGGAGPLDGRMRPVAGDVFTLVLPDGSIERAPLVERVYV